MGNCNDILKRFLGVFVFCCSALVVLGEGSKDLYPKTGSTGFRASLLSTPTTGPNAVISSNSAVGIRFPNPGRQFVYAKFGEVIHVGSSAQGVVGNGFSPQTGTINLVAPNGTTYTSGTSTTVGKINFQSEEEVGPSLTMGDGGYTSYSRTVGLGEEGIWVIDFVAPNQTAIVGSDLTADLNATSLAVTNGFTSTNHQQTKSRYIVAWDVTVVTGGTRQTGRVYQTVFSADLGLAGNSLCDKSKFYVISKDGYQYLVEPKAGFRPFQFAFFANNKGVRYNTGPNAGLSAYRSAKNSDVENAFSDPLKPYDYHVPSDADDGTNITYKLFYNTPDNVNLPATASIATSVYGSSSTWLFPSAPIVPTLTDLALVGKEGTPGKFSTTAPLTGGFITFNSNQAGAYRILIDANNDGDYTDNVDLTLRGDAVSGANSIAWDGKDGLGNLLTNTTTIKVNAVTLAGEVHFPLADAEKNLNGIQITRLNGTGAPTYTVYWNDQFLDFTGDAGASSPLTNLDNGPGESSITNGHKWGTAGGNTGAGIFGDQAVIDTWTNVFSADQNLNVTITSQVADLEIVSLVGNLTNICVGTEVTYTFIARNIGPNNSGNATVSFVMPAELTTTSLVSANVTSGTATGVGGTFSGTTFIDVLSMDDDAEVTYVIKGTIASYPAGGNLNTSARILRAADVTDPDATNDDVAPPTDPVSECNGNPSGVGCNNIKNLTTVVQALPSNADAGPNQAKCNDGNFTMAAVTPAVGTGAWSLISGTATITNAALSNTTVTGVPVGTTATLRWTISNGTCTPTTADITLTNNNPPSAAVLTTAATLTNCGNGTFNIGAVTPTNGTGQWTVFSGTGTITNANATSTTVTGVANGSTVIIRWTVSSAGCTSNMTDVTLTNNPPVSTATLTTAATLTNCGDGTFNIGAVTPTVGTGQWTVLSGTATITNANATSTTVTAVPNGSTAIIRWTVSSAGCTSSFTDVTVVNNNPPSAAVLTTAATLTNCGNGTFSIGAVTPTNGTGQWTVFSGTGTITNANATSTTVTGVANGSTVIIRWTVSSAGCTSNMTDVTLTNNSPVSTATLTTAATLTNCGDGTFNIGAVTPTVGTGQWTVLSGTATITNANATSTTVTAVPNGSTAIIRWTVSSAGCTSSFTDVTVVNNNPPSAAVLTTAATLTNCGNGTFNIGAVTPTVGTGQWTVLSGTATITNANATSTTVTGVANGSTVIIRWTVSSAGCTSNMTDVTLTNNPPVSTATLTTAATLTNCGDGTFNIGAVTPTVGTGQWTVLSGTATITNANATSTTVTGVANGSTAIIRWTVSSAGCTSSFTDVTVVNNNPPSAAVLTTAATLTNCGNGTFNIGAVTPTNGTGQWTVFSGTATITNANATSTTVTGVANGSTVIIRWTVSSAGCTSNMTDVTLVNDNGPSTATLNTAATLTNCNNPVFNIAAVTPIVGTGVWTVFSGTATISNANATSTTVSNVTAGSSVVLRWTVSSPGCTSNAVDVTLLNNALPSNAALVSAATLTNCNNGVFNIEAVVPTIGTGVWSVISGTATIANTTAASTQVTAVTAGTTVVLRWTVSNGTCTPTSVDITLVNNNAPSTAIAGTNLVNCNNGIFTMAANSPVIGTGVWSLVSGTATITNTALTNTTVTSVQVGSNVTVRWTISAPGCTPSQSDIVLSNQLPPSVANAGANQIKCDNGSFTMAALTPTAGSGNWSIVSGLATIVSSHLTNTMVTGIPVGTSTTLRWTVTNGICPTSTADVILTNSETVNAGSNLVISCTTTAKVPAALSGQTWTASASNPSAASINSNGDITGLITKGLYQFTLMNTNCSVTITVTKNNCPPVALNDTQTVRNDQVLTGTLKPKVSDPDSDVLVLSLLVPPTRGTIVFNPDGTYTYTPPADYVGTDSITYRVCDADGLCADAKLYINITGAPKPPIAINDSTTTLKNIPVSGNVLVNDYNQGTNSNTGLIVTTTPVLSPANGSVILNADGSYIYTPANNFTGLDSFRYVICNAQALCDTATVYIRINEPPALQPKLVIEKRIDPVRTQYGTGELVTYTLVAKSTGNTTVNTVSVQDILPSSSKIQKVKLVQGSPSAGIASYEAITNMIFWSIPFIHAGDSATLTYTLVLTDSGTLINTATISSPMINGIADTASVSINVVNQADIKISKLLRAPAIISVNDEIGFTMIAENFGPAIGTEVVVQDSLHANLGDPRMMAVNNGKVSYDPITRKITWRIDTLLVGQRDSLVIRVKVISGGEIKNGATVKAKQTDPISGNNGAVVSNITGGQVLIEGKPFFIPSVFTPNGDGKNDKFIILGINQYPGSELTIYNRWGNVVYQSKDYKNDWDGRGLNEGTYYYTLNLKKTSGSQRIAGWVQILR